MAVANRFRVAPFALLVVVTLSCLAAQTHAVDCRKFVFAPVCRGIIAKRMFTEKRSSVRALPSTWDAQFRAPRETEDEGLLLAQSFDDVTNMEPRPQEDVVVVRAGSDVVQVPAYVYGVIERSLQGEQK
ncbi:uncharacterized protein LOC122265627 [Penaeus japonicus]|uniref:uncharacterized protein LOC122265627 n=1 Tax=Penaeus japonicus TaxID=27405 RepID=UPI001C710C4A|nr:uncharacterized protein LOC122265627 [Penaeus japonicus]